MRLIDDEVEKTQSELAEAWSIIQNVFKKENYESKYL